MEKRHFLKGIFVGLGLIASKKANALKETEKTFLRAYATVTPSTSPSPSGTPSTSPSPSGTPSTSPSPSRTPSLTPSSSSSLTPSSSASLSISLTPSNSISLSPTPSRTSSLTPSGTPSLSPSISGSPSNSAPVSITPSNTISISASPSPSISSSPSLTSSASLSISPTPSITPSVSSVLPIDLLFFDLTLQRNGNVLITFATTSETNNKGFEIIRKNGSLSTEKIGWLNGNGNSYQLNKYLFEDKNTITGETYIYELLQHDTNGSFKSIGTKAIYILNTQLVISEFFPNPASSKAYITIDSLKSSKLEMSIIDSIGKLVFNNFYNIKAGVQTIEISLKDFLVGVYVCNLTINNEIFTRRLSVN